MTYCFDNILPHRISPLKYRSSPLRIPVDRGGLYISEQNNRLLFVVNADDLLIH